MANASEPTSFAAALRQRRLAAGLTQEALAERAGMSVRGIQNLEGGVTRPLRDSARRLAASLDLSDSAQAAFLATAQSIPRQLRAEANGRSGPMRHNLPVQVTSFVGRERELADLEATLDRARLTTLTGTGGVGKTRLALQAAAEVLERFTGGVWLVELAPLADAERVPSAVASVLAVREQPGQSVLATLIAALRPRRLLVLIDNCEHLLDACARLADALLRGCPEVRILATSRAALEIAGETTFRVPSLTLPNADRSVPPEEIMRAEAVRLFCDRANAARRGFTLSEQNAPTVARLCQQLDGLPLALELAATRTRSLGVRQLAENLDERFRLLTGGNRAALPRQQTLQATIDWSYDLLDDAERRLFQRLAVFAGGWTLEAAQTVCSGEGLAPGDVLDLLVRLVEQSLVQVEEQLDGSERYRLLETLRAYARERLDQSAEARTISVRHAEYYLALAKEAAPHLRGPREGDWRRQLVPELDNFRGGLRWWLDHGEAECGLQTAVSLFGLWGGLGLTAEGLGWVTALLALPGMAQTPLRGAALIHAAISTNIQGDLERAEFLARQALGSFLMAGDRRGEAQARSVLARLVFYQGRYGEAVRLYESCLALWRQLRDAAWNPFPLLWKARALIYGGDTARARPCIEEAMVPFRPEGDPYACAMAKEFRGEAAEADGDDSAARTHYEAALAGYQEAGDQAGSASIHTFLGRLALKGGDRQEARQRFQQGLSVANATGMRVRLCDALEGLAALAAEEGQPERALRLAAAGNALRGTGVASPMQRAFVAERLEHARQTLGEHKAAASLDDGGMLSLEEAVAEALQPD